MRSRSQAALRISRNPLDSRTPTRLSMNWQFVMVDEPPPLGSTMVSPCWQSSTTTPSIVTMVALKNSWATGVYADPESALYRWEFVQRAIGGANRLQIRRRSVPGENPASEELTAAARRGSQVFRQVRKCRGVTTCMRFTAPHSSRV